MGKNNQFVAYQQNAAAYDVQNLSHSRSLKIKSELICAFLANQRRNGGQSILEVGCGTGLFTERIARLLPDASITATDAFPAMLDIARQRLARYENVRLAQYDAEAPPAFAEKFDVVCGMDIIHHLDDPVLALKNWVAAVKPGATLIFSEANAYNPVLRFRARNQPEEARFKFNTRKNLSGWMTAAGWEATEIDYVPLYLPSGPEPWWGYMAAIESVLHAVPPMRLLSGCMTLRARAP
jgi:2-polyprenyl-3-methyl-5-hydroxy-6-metoxy-1,4-benzoquinol methylase